MQNGTVRNPVRIGIAGLCAAILGIAGARGQPASPATTQAIAPAEVRRILSFSPQDAVAREQALSPEIRDRLASIRAQVAQQGGRFSVGYTPALELPLEVLAGTRIPRSQPGIAATVNRRAAALRSIDIESARLGRVDLSKLLAACSPRAAAFDWRRSGKVTPVKAQSCGTCWDFTAMGAYEGSYAIRNGAQIDTSEQHILNCAGAGTCAGGWWMPVYDYMLTHGAAHEQSAPFTGNDHQACPGSIATPFRAASWGFVANDVGTIPTVQAIKQALCAHGPLATALQATPAFQAYDSTDAVFDESSQHFDWINHGVVIIGWDDAKRAWLIKNSWGPAWGGTGGFGTERGYAWVAWNSNNIGIATAWVDAVSTRFALRPEWLQKMKQLDLKVQPLPRPEPLNPLLRPNG